MTHENSVNKSLTARGSGGGGGGGGAPAGASYVTIGADATLTAERTLAVTAALGLTDGGPGAAVTLDRAALTGEVTASAGSNVTTIANLAVTDAKVATANKDGAAGTPSMRTLGTGAAQACAGNDSRLSDSRTPTGSAGGQLSGTYPNPNVIGLRETSGPTNLTMGAVSDGQYLRRSGTTVIGGTPAGGSLAVSSYEKDVGGPTFRGKFTVVDASISSSSNILVWQHPGPYTGKGALADCAETDPVVLSAEPASGSMTVRWQTIPQPNSGSVSTSHGLQVTAKDRLVSVKAFRSGRIVGNLKINYVVLT